MSGNVNRNSDLTNVDRARAAWGADVPRWVLLLAAACDATNQRKAGEEIGKSAGYVSRVLSKSYTGDLVEAEKIVRAAWGREDVNCPLWGLIPLASCMHARRREAPPTNKMHHLHRRTCPTCPNNPDAHLLEQPRRPPARTGGSSMTPRPETSAPSWRIAVLHFAWLFPTLWALAWGVMAVTP